MRRDLDDNRVTGERRGVAAMLIVFAAATTVGCGNGLANVSGEVTLDGQVLSAGQDVRATVCFNPIDAKGAAATALVNGEGYYRLSTGSKSGVQPGEYSVTFTATKLIRGKAGIPPRGQRISPPRYASPATSGLRFTVEPGPNTINLELTSDDA